MAKFHELAFPDTTSESSPLKEVRIKGVSGLKRDTSGMLRYVKERGRIVPNLVMVYL